jgi:hypothetical protein
MQTTETAIQNARSFAGKARRGAGLSSVSPAAIGPPNISRQSATYSDQFGTRFLIGSRWESNAHLLLQGAVMRKRKLFIWLALIVATLFLFQPQSNAAQGPGRVDIPLIAGQQYEAGTVTIHNNNGGLLIDVQTANGWKMTALHVHAGWTDNPVPMRSGNPVPAKFDFKYEYEEPATGEPVWLDFVEGLQGFRWGAPYEAQRERYIAVHADVVLVDEYGKVVGEEGAWAQGDIAFEGGAVGLVAQVHDGPQGPGAFC